MKFYFFSSIVMMIMMIVMVLISVAFLTLFERKIMGLFHYRKGPNKVSLMGILQPFSDAMKLISKEFFIPMKSNFIFYFSSPMLMFILSTSIWLIYPFYTNLISFKFNTLFFFSIMSMGVYGLMMSGWSSNSSFSMIGSIRSIAQSISYEVIFSISILIILMMINTFNLNNLMNMNKFSNILLFYTPLILILISMLAEINRTPFDLSEGESELVSGFNIEYSSGKFILIFLSEYSSLMFMMFLINMLTMKNNFIIFCNTILMIYFITWIRMTYPRIRYDKLMFLCWFFFLPFTLINFMMFTYFFKYPLDLMLTFNLMNFKIY